MRRGVVTCLNQARVAAGLSHHALFESGRKAKITMMFWGSAKMLRRLILKRNTMSSRNSIIQTLIRETKRLPQNLVKFLRLMRLLGMEKNGNHTTLMVILMSMNRGTVTSMGRTLVAKMIFGNR